MRRHGRWLVIALGSSLLVGVGALVWHLRAQQQTFYTDADTIHLAAEEGAPRDVMWQPPVRLADLVNSGADEHGASLSFDGNLLVFVRGRAGQGADLYEIARGPDGWGQPVALVTVNTRADELRPCLSPDASALYLASDRRGGAGGYDLWVARRGPEGWRAAEPLGPEVNSRYDEYAPAVAPDGRSLYFASNRPDPDDATAPPPEAWATQIADDAARRDYDLYVATRSGGRFATVMPLDTLNTTRNESAPALSPVGDFIYFASDRPGGAGGFDLYRARIAGGTVMAPASLQTPVNTAANELDPALSLGGFGLHFASDRSRDANAATAGDYDLHYTRSREVFMLIETWRSQFDLAALWAMIWPWLLITLLAVIVLLALLDIFRRLEYRRLGLIVKCLLVSLIAHMLLLVTLAFWAVSVAPQAWMRPSRGMKVALTSSALGAGITRQLRGDLVNPELASAVQAVAKTEYLKSPGERFQASTIVAVDRAELQLPALSLDAQEARPPDERAPPARHIEPEQALAQIDVNVPAAEARPTRREATAESEVASHVTSGRPAPRADGAAVVPSPAVQATAVPLAPGRARAAPSAARLTANEARDAAAPAPVLVDRADDSAARDLGGVVALELAVLPERTAGDPQRAEQGVLGEAQFGARASAASVSVPAAAPWESVEVTLGSLVTEIAEGSLAAPSASEATAAPMVPSAAPAPSDALVALPDLELPVLPEYHRTQLGQPLPEEPGRVASAAPAEVQTPLAAAPALRPLAPETPTPVPEASSFALLQAAEAQPAPAARGDDLGAIGPDPLQLALAPMEEAPQRPQAEVAAGVVSGEPRAPRAEFQPLEPAAPFAAPEFEVASPREVAEVPLPPEMPVQETPPAPAERQALDALPATALALLPLDLRMPTQTIPNPYPQRDPERRLEVAKQMGGDEKTEEAVVLALDWLARHQSADGRWDGTHFDAECGGCSGVQQVKSNIALSGLALMCFQAAGHTHQAQGPYRDVVRRGIDWLLAQQRPGGALLADESLYSHGIAMIALAEAYGMTGDPRLERPVKAGCDFIYAARHKPRGGWRYTPGQYGDTSVIGWQIMALTSARRAKIDVPEEAFEVARHWMRLVDHPRRPGQYRYQPDRNVTPAMTAEGMFVQQLLGVRRDERPMRGSAQYILRHPPRWDIDPNTYYWYYATLALFQHQGEAWARWNEAVKDQLLAHQVREGSAAGSWDPEGRWSQVAGRIYQTTMCTLTLEVYYRYLPSFVIER